MRQSDPDHGGESSTMKVTTDSMFWHLRRHPSQADGLNMLTKYMHDVKADLGNLSITTVSTARLDRME